MERWVFYALIAVWHDRALPKRQPEGTSEYVAALVKARPEIKLFQKLQQRLMESRFSPKQQEQAGTAPSSFPHRARVVSQPSESAAQQAKRDGQEKSLGMGRKNETDLMALTTGPRAIR